MPCCVGLLEKTVCDPDILAPVGNFVGVLQFGSHTSTRSAGAEQIEALCREHEKGCFDTSRNGQIVRVDLPMREVSSTAIRQRVALGQGIDDLVDADVAQYIHRNKLYKDDITLREKTF